ncbi:12693_t:CDS:1, partial [Gigaspora rosea]
LATSSYQQQINNTFESHNEFVDKIKNYEHNRGFTIRLGKSEFHKKPEHKESEKNIQKITLLFSSWFCQIERM